MPTPADKIELSVGTETQATAHFVPWFRLVYPPGVALGNIFIQMGPPPPTSTLFPYTTLFRSIGSYVGGFYDGTGSYRLTLAKGPGAVEVSTGDEGGPMTNGATNGRTHD